MCKKTKHHSKSYEKDAHPSLYYDTFKINELYLIVRSVQVQYIQRCGAYKITSISFS